MQRRTLLSLPIVGIALPGCTRAHRQDEVFAWYLRAILEGSRKDGPQLKSIRLVVESKVSAYSASLGLEDVAALSKHVPAIRESTVSDLRLHLEDAMPIKLPASSLPDKVKVDYVTSEQLRAIFDEKLKLHQAWKNFYGTYAGAGGIVAFSPAGFSADGNQAVFVSAVRCGGLCGSGFIVLMRRSLTGWAIAETQQLWVS